jgi:pimeloyl-ACP methyl ester carboxylesterase
VILIRPEAGDFDSTGDILRADVFGYSMGGRVAVALAIKHPDLVRKLAILGAGTGATKDSYDPESYKQFKSNQVTRPLQG